MIVNFDYYTQMMGDEYKVPAEGFGMKSMEAETIIRSIVRKEDLDSDVVKGAICWQIAFMHINYGAGTAGVSGGEVASTSYSVGGESESVSYVSGGKGKAKMVGGLAVAPFAYLTLSQNGLLGAWRNVAAW